MMTKLEVLKYKNKKNRLYRTLVNSYNISLINNINIEDDFFFKQCIFKKINEVYNNKKCFLISDSDYHNNLKNAMKILKDKTINNFKGKEIVIGFEDEDDIYFFLIKKIDLLNNLETIINYFINYNLDFKKFHDIIITNRTCGNIINFFQIESKMYMCVYDENE